MSTTRPLDEPVPPAEVGLRDLLRHRPFRYQFLARASSNVGTSIAPVAMTLGILHLTKSATTLALTLSAHTVTFVAFVLFGGVLADRLPRQRVMAVADGVRTITQGIFAALFFTGQEVVSVFIALQAINGVASAFAQPASAGLTRATCPRSLLQSANALLTSTRNISAVVGPAVAGVIFASAGAGPIFLIDALSFAVSATFLSRLRLPPTDRAGNSLRVELAAGWQQVVRRRWISTSLICFGFENLVVAAFLVLGPIALGAQAGGNRWAFVVSAMAVGQLVGSASAMSRQVRRPLVVSRVVLLLILPMMAAVAYGAPLVVLLAASGVAGVAMSYPDIVWSATLQSHVSADTVARVASYDMLVSLAARPVGYTLAGVATALAGESSVIAILGLALVGVLGLGLLPRSVWTLDDSADRSASEQQRT